MLGDLDKYMLCAQQLSIYTQRTKNLQNSAICGALHAKISLFEKMVDFILFKQQLQLGLGFSFLCQICFDFIDGAVLATKLLVGTALHHL